MNILRCRELAWRGRIVARRVSPCFHVSESTSIVNWEFCFKSTAFNCTEPRDNLVNPGSFGDDVALWLIGEREARGVETLGDPGQEDYGWYVRFNIAGAEHCVIVGFQPNDPSTGDQWLLFIERQAGFLGSLFGSRKRGISAEAVSIIQDILATSPKIRDLRSDGCS
jgi:hypothetical protein